MRVSLLLAAAVSAVAGWTDAGVQDTTANRGWSSEGDVSWGAEEPSEAVDLGADDVALGVEAGVACSRHSSLTCKQGRASCGTRGYFPGECAGDTWCCKPAAPPLPPAALQSSGTTKAGLQTGIMKNALNYVQHSLLTAAMRHRLIRELDLMKDLPADAKKQKTLLYKMELTTGFITAVGLNQQQSHIYPQAPNLVKVDLRGIDIDIAIRMKLGLLLGGLEDTLVTVHIRDARLAFDVHVGAANGRPTASVENLSLSVPKDSFDVRLSQGVNRHGQRRKNGFKNMIINWFEGRALREVIAAIEAEAPKAVNDILSELLKGTPDRVEVSKDTVPGMKDDMVVKWDVLRPAVSAERLLMQADLTVFSAAAGKCSDACPAVDTPKLAGSERMIEFRVSDRIMCCAINAAYDDGILAHEGDVPIPTDQDFGVKGVKELLQAVVDNFKIHYKVKASSAPRIECSSTDTSLKAQFEVELELVSVEGDEIKARHQLLKTTLAASAAVSLALDGKKIGASLGAVELTIGQVNLVGRELTQEVKDGISKFADFTIENDLRPIVDGLLTTGYEIYMPPGLDLTSPQLSHMTNGLVVLSDFEVKLDTLLETLGVGEETQQLFL